MEAATHQVVSCDVCDGDDLRVIVPVAMESKLSAISRLGEAAVHCMSCGTTYVMEIGGAAENRTLRRRA